MKYIDDENGIVHTPEPLAQHEVYELESWIAWPGPEANALQEAAYHRNLLRIAEAFGPRMIATMTAANVIEPFQDPAEALQVLIERRK